MRMDTLIKWLMPKEERFQQLLREDTKNLVSAARLFAEIAQSESLEERRIKAVQLKVLEHDGDLITRHVFEALNSSFITPLDREDIRAIGSDLDDILDFLEGVGHSLVLFELKEAPEGLRQFAAILVSMIEEIHRVTDLIWNQAHEAEIQRAIMRISELENQGDTLYSAVIADLFKEGRNPIEVLKWKEIYDGLENACDECKDFTHSIANVVIKNA